MSEIRATHKRKAICWPPSKLVWRPRDFQVPFVSLDVGGGRLRGKPQWGQMSSVKGVLNEWGLSVGQGRLIVHGRNS